MRVVTGLKLKVDFNYVSFICTATVKSFSGTEAEFSENEKFCYLWSDFSKQMPFLLQVSDFSVHKV